MFYKLVFCFYEVQISAWSILASHLHLSLLHLVTMPASLLHLKETSAA